MIHFRRLRRLTAAAMHLLLLQLVHTGGAGVCPLLGDGMAPMAMTETVGPGATHAHDARRGGGGTGADAPAGRTRATSATSRQTYGPASEPGHDHAGAQCDMACAPAGCGVVGHCSDSAATSSTPPSALLASADGRHTAAPDGAPRSVSSAPEPPPPRA